MSAITRTILTVAATLVLTAQGCSISIRTARQLDGGIFRSDDAGITWTHIVDAGTTPKGKPIRIDNVDIEFIRFDPITPTIVFLGTRGAGIYRSDDGGNRWVKTGLGGGTYTALAIDPTAPTILYAAAGGTITKSGDGGAHWAPIYLESKPDRVITDLAIKPTDPSMLLAATSRGDVLLSRDYGNTWQLLTTLSPADYISRMLFPPNNSSTVYAVTRASGLFRSTDTGNSWESAKQSLQAFPGSTTVSSVATMTGQPQTLYLASGYGLLVTRDGGATWQPINTLVPFGSQPIQAVTVNPTNEATLYVIVGNRLRKSTDGGATWDAKITVPTARLLNALTINPDRPNQLYLGTIKPRK
ncbi:MAG: hypothetical protein HY567_02525 [Candidatus Kerfeldbacteria bacterium]|nr:hypothetical protein [Candidatus Kerfeldbacteria bacterium]